MNDNLKSQTAFSPQKRKLLEQMLASKGLATSAAQKAAMIPRRPQNAGAPLGLNQEGLWFIDQMDPGQAHYNIPGTVRLRGRLNVAALQKSFHEIVCRHEILRTTFAINADGVPYQVIAAARPVELPVIDLRAWPVEKRETEIVRLATAAAQKTFDLANDPLFFFQLLQLGEEEHVFILNFHHIVCDGWSMGVFTAELRLLYEAFSKNESSPLPALPIQYADFAIWERERLQGEFLQTRLGYWKKQLGGRLPVLELPTDKPRPAVQSFRGRHQSLMIPKPLTGALKVLAQREHVTLFNVLLAAFKTLLYRYSMQDDVIVGTGIANRERREVENLIGYFATVLPLRTNLSGNPAFRELLQRVREVIWDATANQGLPLSQLVQELQPERDPSRNPIYQTEFTLLTPDRNPAVYGFGMSRVMETIQLGDLIMTPVEIEGGISRFDLAIFIWDMPEGLCGTIEYCTDLFEDASITRVIAGFKILLEFVVADPDLRLLRLIERLDKLQPDLRAKSYQETMQQKLKTLKRRPAGATGNNANS